MLKKRQKWKLNKSIPFMFSALKLKINEMVINVVPYCFGNSIKSQKWKNNLIFL